MSTLAVTTVAGTGTASFGDGQANVAAFSSPIGICVGSDGAIYVADYGNHVIRIIKDGKVSVFAGAAGAAGFQDGTVQQARFNGPRYLAIDSEDTIYLSDYNNHRIRMIKKGAVSTVAGNGSASFADGAALSSSFCYPTGIAIAPDCVYIVEQGNCRVRMLKNNYVSTLAGCGTAGFQDGATNVARFNTPQGICVGPQGEVYVSDQYNQRIRMIKNSVVSTVAGNGTASSLNGPALQASLNSPASIAISPTGTLFWVDSTGHCLRMLGADGVVSIVAGQANAGGFRDGVATTAQFHTPYGMCISESGHIYVCDSGAPRIRCVESPEGPYYRHIDISKCLSAANVPTTVDININSVVYKLHRCLIELRCPQLLKASLAKLPVEKKISQQFIQYIYNDRLPKYTEISRADRTEILGFSSLLYKAGFSDQSLKCLEALSASCRSLSADLTAEDLIGLYSYALDLAPFEIGLNTCLNLLLSHKTSLPSKKFPELLKNHSDCLFELVQFLLEGNQLPLPTKHEGDESAPVAPKSLNECLQTLLKTKNGSDFEILIGSDKKHKFACHSFVLYARWPYFKRLLDSGMSETKSKKLSLPAPGKDCGMPPVFLRAILEVCYQGNLSSELRKDLSPSVAMQALATRDLYVDDSEDEQEERTFKHLIHFCQQQADSGLSVENCVDTYKVALELGVDAMAQKAKQLFVNNIKNVMKNPSQIETLFSLRESEQISLLWQAVFVISSKF